MLARRMRARPPAQPRRAPGSDARPGRRRGIGDGGCRWPRATRPIPAASRQCAAGAWLSAPTGVPRPRRAPRSDQAHPVQRDKSPRATGSEPHKQGDHAYVGGRTALGGICCVLPGDRRPSGVRMRHQRPAAPESPGFVAKLRRRRHRRATARCAWIAAARTGPRRDVRQTEPARHRTPRRRGTARAPARSVPPPSAAARTTAKRTTLPTAAPHRPRASSRPAPGSSGA